MSNTKSRGTILIGLAFSLSAGFFDLILTAVSHNSPKTSLDSMLASAALVALCLFCLYLPLRLVLKRAPSLPASMATGSFLGLFFLLSSLWIHVTAWANAPTKILSFAVFFAISFLMAVLIYFFAQKMEDANRISGLALTLPFLLVETWIAVYTHDVRGAALFSWSSVVVLIPYFVIAGTTLYLFARIRPESQRRLLSTLFIVVLLIPAASWLVQYRRMHSPVAAGSEKKTPVVLITIDTLRADALSVRGSKQVNTPNMDALGSDGVIFSNAFTLSPWTVPSLVSLMTGQPPLVHQVFEETGVLPDRLPTLAEQMRAAGYYTASIVSNPYIEHSGLARGFDEFHALKKRTESSLAWMIRSLFLPKNNEMNSFTGEITERSLRFLKKSRSANFFLWLHYLDPHSPYSPPSAYVKAPISGTVRNPFEGLRSIRTGQFVPNDMEKENIRELYLGEVRYVDHQIGRITKSLKDLGLYDSALIVLTSDHGEEFWEHGGYEHGHTLYNELLKVPLIVKLPRSSTKSVASDRVTIPRIASTIMSECKVKSGQKFTDRPLLEGSTVRPDDQPHVAAGMFYFDPKVSVLFENFKYIKNLNTGSEELYDLTGDPGELVSLARNMPERLLMARDILAEHYKSSQELRKKNGIANRSEEMDEHTQNQLRSLGYLQ